MLITACRQYFSLISNQISYRRNISSDVASIVTLIVILVNLNIFLHIFNEIRASHF
jgi:hypothetical protein